MFLDACTYQSSLRVLMQTQKWCEKKNQEHLGNPAKKDAIKSLQGGYVKYERVLKSCHSPPYYSPTLQGGTGRRQNANAQRCPCRPLPCPTSTGSLTAGYLAQGRADPWCPFPTQSLSLLTRIIFGQGLCGIPHCSGVEPSVLWWKQKDVPKGILRSVRLPSVCRKNLDQLYTAKCAVSAVSKQVSKCDKQGVVSKVCCLYSKQSGVQV